MFFAAAPGVDEVWELASLDDLEAALPALEAAAGTGSENPVPLFLATEWLLDAGQVERAAGFYARALQMAEGSRHDFSGFTGPIGARLATAAE